MPPAEPVDVAAERVGIDYVPAATHWPGVGRWARELVRALAREDDAPPLGLWQVAGRPQRLPEAALGLAGSPLALRGGLVRRRLPLPRRALGVLARAGLDADRLLGGIALLQRFRAGEPPLRPRRTGAGPTVVLAVSELPAPGTAGASRLARELERGAHALVTSAHAAAELASRFGLPPERAHRVPVGCDHWAREWARELAAPERSGTEAANTEAVGGEAVGGARDGVRERALTEPPVVLALGAVRPARHTVELLRAVEALDRDGLAVRLVLAGRRGPDSAGFEAALAASPVAPRVTWFDAPDERALPRLVATAGVLVHLADSELTAVTPLEALSLGTPVVASRLPAFVEALAPAGEPDSTLLRFVATAPLANDAAPLAAAIAGALETAYDEDRRAARRALAAPFTWARHAAAVARAWRAILDRESAREPSAP